MRFFDSIRQRAIELARTGQHIDCITIEMALEREGFRLAFDALRDNDFRAQLSALCAEHWGLSCPKASSDEVAGDDSDRPSFDGVPYPVPFTRGSDSSDEA